MYEQSLVKEVEPLKLSLVSSMNKARKWKYGYDKEHDIIVISKNGEIGKIYDIQGLVVALPKVKKLEKGNDLGNNKWTAAQYPEELKNIKNIFDWKKYPDAFKEEWEDYINNEFKRRDEGY